MQGYEDRLMRVLRYIHDNPAGDLSLDRLADVAALSRFHWHRVFHAMTGETCAQAVRRVRLHRAATMLLVRDDPPEAIARAVGYDNPRSFARAFAAQYGASPVAFRREGVHVAPLMTKPQGDRPMYPVTIRDQTPFTLVGVDHKGAYDRIGAAFETFFARCQAQDLWPRLDNPVGIYLDNPEVVPEAELRSFAGAELRAGPVPEGLAGHEIAGGRHAVLTVKGPHALLPGAYDALFGRWLPGSGEEPADAPCFERYLNNPIQVAPDALVTEISLPLKARRDG